MSRENEYGDDFIVISDEDGNEYELEHLDTIEFEGQVYMAFLPVSENEEDEYASEDTAGSGAGRRPVRGSSSCR